MASVSAYEGYATRKQDDGRRAGKPFTRSFEHHMETCRFRIVSDEPAFGALKQEWDELYQESTEKYFTQSFEWCWWGWTKVGKPRGGTLFCLVGTRGGRTVLIWPFVLRRKFLWLVAHPLGSEATEFSNLLLENGPDADRLATSAWQFLRQNSPSDVMLLPFVRDGSALHRLISGTRVWRLAEQFTGSQVDWGGSPDWETYYRSLHKKQRLDIGRCRRRLMETGKVEFSAAVEVGQEASVVDWILEQKRHWLIRTERQSNWLGTEEYRNLLLAVAPEAARDGRMIFSALKVDDTIIAACIGRIESARIESFLTAYDPSYRVFSPSHLLYEDFLKWSFERGFEVDFRIGDEHFKDYWHLIKYSATSYQMAMSPWGIVLMLLQRARHRWRELTTRLRGQLRRRTRAAAKQS